MNLIRVLNAACNRLTARHMQWLNGQGVPVTVFTTVSIGLARVVFEADGTWRPGVTAVQAFVLPANDPDTNEIVDLLAFDKRRMAWRLGDGGVIAPSLFALHEPEIFSPQGGLIVFSEPWAWLKAGCAGVLWAEAEEARAAA